MNWKFWKKPAPEPEPDPRVLVVPADKTREILALADAYMLAPKAGDRVACYDLWKAIFEAVPETAVGSWTFKVKGGTTILLTEGKKGGA